MAYKQSRYDVDSGPRTHAAFRSPPTVRARAPYWLVLPNAGPRGHCFSAAAEGADAL